MVVVVFKIAVNVVVVTALGEMTVVVNDDTIWASDLVGVRVAPAGVVANKLPVDVAATNAVFKLLTRE